MYIATWQEKDEFWGAPCFRTESELIEADGEAEAIFLDNCFQNGYAERYFTAIDDVSQDDIELDIEDYIGHKAYDRFENVLINFTEDDGELSRTKIESWYLACLKAKR